MQKLLDDVQAQYDDKLGFESRIEKLKEQLGKVKIDYDRFSSSLFLNPFTGTALLRLFKQDAKDEEIILVSRMLKDENVKGNIQLLGDKVKEYKDLKRVIVYLQNKVEILKNKVELL